MLIHKYPLKIERKFTIEMPSDYQFIKVDMQDDKPMLWVMCNPNLPKVDVEMYCVETGGQVPETSRGHVGTVIQKNGLVWHFFAA